MTSHSGLACVSLINEKKGPKKYQKPKNLQNYFNLGNFKHLDQITLKKSITMMLHLGIVANQFKMVFQAFI